MLDFYGDGSVYIANVIVARTSIDTWRPGDLWMEINIYLIRPGHLLLLTSLLRMGTSGFRPGHVSFNAGIIRHFPVNTRVSWCMTPCYFS